MLWNKGIYQNEKLQLESSPYSLQLDKRLCSDEDPAQPKIIN